MSNKRPFYGEYTTSKLTTLKEFGNADVMDIYHVSASTIQADAISTPNLNVTEFSASRFELNEKLTMNYGFPVLTWVNGEQFFIGATPTNPSDVDTFIQAWGNSIQMYDGNVTYVSDLHDFRGNFTIDSRDILDELDSKISNSGSVIIDNLYVKQLTVSGSDNKITVGFDIPVSCSIEALHLGNNTNNDRTVIVKGWTEYIELHDGEINLNGNVYINGTHVIDELATKVNNSQTSSMHVSSSVYATTSSYADSFKVNSYIEYNSSSATPAWKEGRLFWDSTNHTLGLYNERSDVTLQVGQENYVRCHNATGAPIANGDVVRINGSTGQLPSIEKAIAALDGYNGTTEKNTILGVATHDIANGENGYITTFGIVNGLNTNAFAEGDVLYLSATTSGSFTNTQPLPPYQIIKVGIMVKKSGGNGSILVRPIPPVHISDITMVSASVLQTNDTFVYNGTVITNKNLNTLTVASASYATNAVSASYATNADNFAVSGILTAATASIGMLTSVTSSVVIIDDNFITLNAYSPYQRYAGIEVIDSGSANSASVEWDGANDYWMVVSSSGQSSKLVGTTFGNYGSENSLNTGYIQKAASGNTLNSSSMFQSQSSVGIGTTTPTAPVHIKVSSPATQGLLKVDANGSGGAGAIRVYGNTHTDANGTYLSIESAGGPIGRISTYQSTTPLVLNDQGGNVGIKTATPSASLDVNGSLLVQSGGTFKILNSGGTNYFAVGATSNQFDFGNSTGTNGLTIVSNTPSTGATIKLANSAGAMLIQASASANNLYLTSSNVGIHTTAPAANLHVSGTVILQGLPTYADNAAAIAGGLTTSGSVYKTSTGQLMITY